MTGELRIGVECYFLGALPGTTLTQVVGNIFATTAGNPSERDVPIPVGWQADPTSMRMPAGRYVVQVELPSGQVLSEETEVSDGATSKVELDLGDSPHESHVLHYLLGDIEPGNVYHDESTTYDVPRSDGSRSFDRRPGSLPEPFASNADVAFLRRADPAAAPITAMADLRTLPPPVALATALTALRVVKALPVPVFQPEPVSPIYRFDDGLRAQLLDNAQFHHYATVSTPDDAYLVTVPWPWPRTAAVDVLVNQRQSPTGSPVSVAVHHDRLGAGIGYLAGGSLDKAAVLFGDPEEILWGKVTDPLGAAAAAYALIGTEHTGERQRWDPWLLNLRNWFEEMSDGAILWGARMLRTAHTDADRTEARFAFLEGFQRGLPVYTLGLSWLIDGLMAFPGDAECEQALLATRQLCWQADMREPFVVLRLGGAR